MQAVLLLAARGNLVSQHDLLAAVVHERGEHEFRLGSRQLDGPPGEAARHRDHILLRVAPVDAQRMQLHQLAAVILVETVRLALPRPSESDSTRRLRRERSHLEEIGSHRLPVVQVVEHGRMPRRGQQQVLELTQHVGANGVALVTGQQRTILLLAFVHIEVVEPEIREHFFQLPVGIDRADHLGLPQVAQDDLLRLTRHGRHAAQFGKSGQRILRKRGRHQLELLGVQGGEQFLAAPHRAVARNL